LAKVKTLGREAQHPGLSMLLGTMRAERASRYVDETSMQAFRLRVGTVWPLAISGN